MFVDCMEVVENAKYEKAQTALEAWLGSKAVALLLNDWATGFVLVARAGAGTCSASLDCTAQDGQNNFEQGRAEDPGYFMLVSDERDFSIWVCPGFHMYVPYSSNTNLKVKMTLILDEVITNKRLV